MSIETIERCDVCDEDLAGYKGAVYRRRIRRWWHWSSDTPEDRGWKTICGQCWNEICMIIKEESAERSLKEEQP
jgi:hypothetical protein